MCKSACQGVRPKSKSYCKHSHAYTNVYNISFIYPRRDQKHCDIKYNQIHYPLKILVTDFQLFTESGNV